MYNWKFLLQQLAGENSHHIIEATFKAFARALRQATENDPRRGGTIPRFDLSSITFYYTSLDRINIIDYARLITSYKHILFVILRIFFCLEERLLLENVFECDWFAFGNMQFKRSIVTVLRAEQSEGELPDSLFIIEFIMS